MVDGGAVAILGGDVLVSGFSQCYLLLPLPIHLVTKVLHTNLSLSIPPMKLKMVTNKSETPLQIRRHAHYARIRKPQLTLQHQPRTRTRRWRWQRLPGRQQPPPPSPSRRASAASAATRGPESEARPGRRGWYAAATGDANRTCALNLCFLAGGFFFFVRDLL